MMFEDDGGGLVANDCEANWVFVRTEVDLKLVDKDVRWGVSLPSCSGFRTQPNVS